MQIVARIEHLTFMCKATAGIGNSVTSHHMMT